MDEAVAIFIVVALRVRIRDNQSFRPRVFRLPAYGLISHGLHDHLTFGSVLRNFGFKMHRVEEVTIESFSQSLSKCQARDEEQVTIFPCSFGISV